MKNSDYKVVTNIDITMWLPQQEKFSGVCFLNIEHQYSIEGEFIIKHNELYVFLKSNYQINSEMYVLVTYP